MSIERIPGLNAPANICPMDNPFDTAQWVKRDTWVKDFRTGEYTFHQKDVECPAHWSQEACNILASKYFFGRQGTAERETSVRQVLHRIARLLADWGQEEGHFDHNGCEAFYRDLVYLMLHQYAAFNSPVWFNLGLHHVYGTVSDGGSVGYWYDAKAGKVVEVDPMVHPQASACFILRMEDSITDIWMTALRSAVLFKYGSGVGMDLSRLRSRYEHLSGGGKASGPISFGKLIDVTGGTLKSGGRCLAPGTYVYTSAGPRMVETLVDTDFEVLSYDPPANRYKIKRARAWKSGVKTVVKVITDKGEFRVSSDHPMRLSTGNYCRAGELKPGQSLFNCTVDTSSDGYLRVGLKDGKKGRERLHRLVAKDILGADIKGMAVHHRDGSIFNCRSSNLEVLPQSEHAALHGKETALKGTHVFQQRRFPKAGSSNGMHSSSAFWTDEKKVIDFRNKQSDILKNAGNRARDMAKESVYHRYLNTGYKLLNAGQTITTIDQFFEAYEKVIGRIDSRKRRRKAFIKQFGSYEGFLAELSANNHRVRSVEIVGSSEVYSVEVDCPTPDDKTAATGHNFVIWPGSSPTGSGICVANTRRAAIMLTIKDRHPEFSDFIDLKSEEEKKAKALIAAGYDSDFNGAAYSTVAFQNANLSVRLSNEFLMAAQENKTWYTHHVTDSLIPGPAHGASDLLDKIAKGTWECGDPGVQYEDTIQKWHTCPNSGPINSSNPCSEYMFLDDTACNLASLRLTRFCNDGVFNVELFCRAVRVIFRAQEILVGKVSYPTPAVAENSVNFRPLGIGYADLGALLMRSGVPYDSDNGRAICGAVTALMTGESYRTSAYMASKLGAFAGYEKNRAPMLRVMRRHHEALAPLREKFTVFNQGIVDAADNAWKDALAVGEKVGFRNAQASVLAPTGCVAADTHLLTSEGLLPITELGDPSGNKWQDADFLVAQERDGWPATRFYVNGQDRVYELLTQGGHRIKATWKHRLRVIDADGHYVWRAMQDIQAGDTVVLRLGGHEKLLGDKAYVSLLKEERSANQLPEELDEQTAEILGFYMGNGYVKARGGLHLIGCDKDRDLREAFSAWEDRTGIRLTTEQRQGCTVYNFNDRGMLPWFEKNRCKKPAGNRGEGAAGAFVPTVVLRSRTSVLRAFLRGLFEADGTVTVNGNGTPVVYLATVSQRLAEEVQRCLESLGMAARVSWRLPGKGSKGKRTKYRVTLANIFSQRLFAETVGFLSTRKNSLLSECLNVETTVEDSHNRLVSRPLLDEFYNQSRGLPCAVRQDIGVRKYQGAANITWLRRQIANHPQLTKTRIAQLLRMGDLQFQPVKSCTFVGSENTWDISVPYRNTYLANGFVSHNTISFVMDCDTTGIEPELALVKYKLLAGGGNMKLVNSCVAEALTVLGYTEKAREAILAYVEEKGVVEGAPGIKDEHLAVFDTSFVSPNGTRSIAWMAHLDMMIAAQPFISGAISKTVNMPEGTTVAEIREAIFYGWRGNLKAQALYRDGSKYSQPLSAKEGGNNKTGNEATNAAQQAANLELRGSRRKLPKTRDSITHHFNVGGHDGYVTAGMYEDGTLGEIFVKMNKEGSTIAGLMDTISILTSIGIQHGVPLPLLVEKLSYLDFEPRGMTGDPDVPTARSVVDYVFRWLGTRFKVLNGLYQVMEDDDSYSEISTLKGVWTVSVSAGEDRHTVLTKQKETVTGPPCPTCGSMTVRTGPCFSCHNCGNSTGGCG